MKRLKVKVGKAYNRRKLGQQYLEELKRLSKRLLIAKKMHKRLFKVNTAKCWAEFYKYVKRRNSNRENIPAIKGAGGWLITYSIEKANSLNLLKPSGNFTYHQV
jgi:hypothetical protein